MALFLFKVLDGGRGLENNMVSESTKKSNVFTAFSEFNNGEYDLADPEGANELIDQMYSAGCLPVITVKRKRANEVENAGIHPYTSWIREMGNILVGTYGLPAYIPRGDDRVRFMLKIPRERIKPRMTGPDKSFHGVVFIEGGEIRPDEIEAVGEEPFRERMRELLAA